MEGTKLNLETTDTEISVRTSEKECNEELLWMNSKSIADIWATLRQKNLSKSGESLYKQHGNPRTHSAELHGRTHKETDSSVLQEVLKYNQPLGNGPKNLMEILC